MNVLKHLFYLATCRHWVFAYQIRRRLTCAFGSFLQNMCYSAFWCFKSQVPHCFMEDVAVQTDFVKILCPLSELYSEMNKVGHDQSNMFNYNGVQIGMLIVEQSTATCTGSW